MVFSGKKNVRNKRKANRFSNLISILFNIIVVWLSFIPQQTLVNIRIEMQQHICEIIYNSHIHPMKSLSFEPIK